MSQIKTHLRWMIRRDMPEVLDIEQLSFGDDAWGEDDFIRALRRRTVIGMVAEHDERIVGFMVYDLPKNQIDVWNFAVHPAWRRRGFGRAMIDKLMGKLIPQRRNRIRLEIRDSNLDAQLFFRENGFKATGVIRDAFDYCDDDAYVFERRVEEKATA